MATPNVVVTLSDFTDAVSGAGYFVQLSPSSSHFGATASNSSITFSSVTPGTYVLNMPGTGVKSVKIVVPDEAGPLDAIDLVSETYTRPVAGGSSEVGPLQFTRGSGSPEGVYSGKPGDTYWDADENHYYVKVTGVNTTTGWAIH
jgi:hypothetical protein